MHLRERETVFSLEANKRKAKNVPEYYIDTHCIGGVAKILIRGERGIKSEYCYATAKSVACLSVKTCCVDNAKYLLKPYKLQC